MNLIISNLASFCLLIASLMPIIMYKYKPLKKYCINYLSDVKYISSGS